MKTCWRCGYTRKILGDRCPSCGAGSESAGDFARANQSSGDKNTATKSGQMTLRILAS